MLESYQIVLLQIITFIVSFFFVTVFIDDMAKKQKDPNYTYNAFTPILAILVMVFGIMSGGYSIETNTKYKNLISYIEENKIEVPETYDNDILSIKEQKIKAEAEEKVKSLKEGTQNGN